MMRSIINAIALLLMGFAFGCVMAMPEPAQVRADALACARTTTDFSDSGIARCYTSRGLPVPDDL